MGIYGSPRIFFDLKEAGVECSENRIARLMRAAQIKSVRGYKRPRYKVGQPAQVAPNQLERQFQHDEPDHAWVTDITYIRTHEGWLYLAERCLTCTRVRLWPGAWAKHADALGAGRLDDGGLAKKAKGLGDHSFRSGQSIWQ